MYFFVVGSKFQFRSVLSILIGSFCFGLIPFNLIPFDSVFLGFC